MTSSLRDDVLNIVIPMAGHGSRFREAGYSLPKPLIPLHGVPMIELVTHNIRPSRAHQFVYLVLEEHAARYDLRTALERIAPGSHVVSVPRVTDGAACTVLLARDLIDSDQPLMIANSDQWVDTRIDDYLAAGDGHHADGLIMTMTANDPKWSFVEFDSAGNVTGVREKEPVSSEATVGIYNFTRGSDFVAAADLMIAEQLRVNGEFYVAPVYNSMIDNGADVRLFNVGPVGDRMFGLGTPGDLVEFLGTKISAEAVEGLA